MNTVEFPHPHLALQHHIACLSVIRSPANSWLLGRTGFQVGTENCTNLEKQTAPSLPVNTFPLAEGEKKQTCSVLSPELFKRDVKKNKTWSTGAEFGKKKQSVTALIGFLSDNEKGLK